MTSKRRKAGVSFWFLLVALLFAGWMWLTDFVTVQGERTIYTVDCRGGTWQGDQCTGRLAPAARYRFRVLGQHQEVLFWIAGSKEPSGRFDGCRIHDGRNWECPANAESARTITLAMEHGRAVHDATDRVRAFHAVEKWRWLLLRWGAYAGTSADY